MLDVIPEVTADVLRAFADAWNRHDVDALMSFMTEDCVFEASAGSDVCGTRYVGRDSVRAGFAEVWATFPDAQWHNPRHFVLEERGVSEWTFTGTRADGTRVEVHGVRVGDLVCITPRFSGSKRRWHLRPDEVLVSDLSGNKLDGDGEISREAKVHFALYQNFPDANAILHSHARNVMPFVAAGQPVEPALEATLKFGTIPVSRFSPAHSEKLAEAIVESFQGRDGAIRKYAAAVIAPWHGLFTVGRDLDAPFDLTERIDTNAYCILMSRLLPEGPADPETIQLKLKEAITSSNDHHAHA